MRESPFLFFAQKKFFLASAACLIAVIVLAYGASIRNGFVNWDDTILIHDNDIITSLSPHTLYLAFSRYDPELYIPLTFVSYQIDYFIGGLNPLIYHLDNLLLHILNALLVLLLIYALSRNRWIAFGVAMLFAVHPLNTEAVVWASARKELLFTLFFLLSFLLYLWHRQTDKKRCYYLSIGTFLLGLLSKVTIITLPFILLLWDWHEGRRGWRMVLEKIPYFTLALIFGVIAIFGKHNLSAFPPGYVLLLSAKSLVFYIQKLFLPIHLSIIYPYNQQIAIFSPGMLLPLAIIAGLLLVTWILWSRAKDVAFGILFFLITILPSLFNFYKSEDITLGTDHYAYLPSIGFFFAICCLLSYAYRKYETNITVRSIAGAAGIIVIASLAYASFVRSSVWANTETLFEKALREYPDTLTARMNLASLYIQTKRTNDALKQLHALLLMQPRGRTYRLLGDIYVEENQFTDAESEYKKSIELDPKNPDPYASLATLYAKNQRYDEAVALYKKVLELTPHNLAVHRNLGGIYINLSRYKDAENEARQILAENSSFPLAHYLLALALERQNKIDEAIPEYEKASAVDPNNVDIITSLATLYLYKEQGDAALTLLKRAYRIDPNNQSVQILTRQMMAAGLLQ